MPRNLRQGAWLAACVLVLIPVISSTMYAGPITAYRCGGSIFMGPQTYAMCTDADGTAIATVTGNHLGTRVDLNPSGAYFNAAGASYAETVMFLAPPGGYYINLTFEITGTLYRSNPSVPVPTVAFSWCPKGNGCVESDNWNSVTEGWAISGVQETHTLLSSVHFFQTGVSYDWTFTLFNFSNGSYAGPAGTSYANFLGSAIITDAEVTDQFGNPIQGVVYSTSSGFPLPFDLDGALFVPEPSTLLLLPAGALLLLAAGKRRPGRG
ncbi:MAG: PEP-CTERM sorting domain-containing protein [Acidobacteria bacterium]|nr:PEP-CTERM sorting domain-containing protein [Acidobacteriota bacterium]